MLSLLGDLQAARRLAEGGAADGPRRGGDRQPAGEDAPAATRPARSSRRSWATRRRPTELFARVLQLDPGARRGGRAAVAALLQARGVGAAGADPRDAGAQGRSQDQPRADAALSPAGQGGRPAGRQREGAQVLQAVLRPRLDLPADAGRPGRRCSTSLEHWDDAFRIYQTILVHHRDTQKDDRDRRHLLPPRAASS